MVMLRLLSRLLWLVMMTAGLTALGVSIFVGRTPLAEQLAAITAVAVVVGALVDVQRHWPGALRRALASVRRRWIAWSCVGIAGLAVNAWVQDGAWPVLVIAVAAVGCAVVVAVTGYTATSSVVRHSWDVKAAISSGSPERIRAAVAGRPIRRERVR